MGKAVAIYASDQCVRVIEGSISAGIPNIRRFAKCRTPAGGISGGAVADPRALSDTVSSLLRQNDIRSRRMNVVVDGIKCFYRELRVPMAGGKKLDQLVRTELEYQIGLGSEYMVQYDVLGVEKEDKQEFVRVFATAMLTETVQGYYSFVREMGMKPSRLETSNTSIGRVLLLNSFYRDKAVVTAYLDRSVQLLSLFDRGRLVFARNALMRNTPVRAKAPDAEEAKRLLSAPAAGRTSPTVALAPEPLKELASDHFLPDARQVADIISGIYKLMELQRQRDRLHTVYDVLLFGDVQKDEKLPEQMSFSLGVNVRFLEEPDGVKFPPTFDFLEYGQLIGALMRGNGR